MNFKKLPRFALLALLGLSCGCSNITSSTEGTDTPGTNDGKTEVVFWHTMGATNQEYLNAFIKSFEEENPDIKVTHAAQGGYTDIESKLLKAIPAKTTPTMAFCYPDHVANYIKSGSAVKLNDYINNAEYGLTADELKDYQDAGFWSEGSDSYGADGSVYSVPFSKSTEVLFMNTTWMVKNGFVDANDPTKPFVPTTWEEMWDLCAKIKAKDESITPLGYDSDDNMFITLCEQYGIPYTSLVDGMGSIDFNNAQAKALVTELKGYYDKGYFKTKGTLPNNSYTSTQFVEEKLIMSIGSTGGTKYNVPTTDNGDMAFNVEVFRIPQANPNAPKVISQGPSITFFKNSQISEAQVVASWKFYKHITNAYNSAAYAIFTGYEPVRESSYTSDIYQSHLNATGEDVTLFTKVANLTATEEIKKAYFFSPVFVGSSVARQQAGGIITQVLLGEKTVDEAFDDAETETIFAMA